MPIALIILVSTMKRIDRKSIELAVLYEQNRYEKTLLELGMLLPGILSSFLLVFFLSFGEEGIMLVLMPPGAETVSVKIYNYLHYGGNEQDLFLPFGTTLVRQPHYAGGWCADGDHLLASLYNAPTTMQLSYQNQTNHDLAIRG